MNRNYNWIIYRILGTTTFRRMTEQNDAEQKQLIQRVNCETRQNGQYILTSCVLVQNS